MRKLPATATNNVRYLLKTNSKLEGDVLLRNGSGKASYSLGIIESDPSVVPALHVNRTGNGLHMVWVNAKRVLAKMIKNHAVRNRPELDLVVIAMRSVPLPVPLHIPIHKTGVVDTDLSIPYPTGSRVSRISDQIGDALSATVSEFESVRLVRSLRKGCEITTSTSAQRSLSGIFWGHLLGLLNRSGGVMAEGVSAPLGFSYFTRTCALLLIISAALIPSNASAVGGDCETWAANYSYPRQSVRMAQVGCVESSPRVYVNRPGLCNQVARQAARNGYMGGAAVQYVERKVPTCYWDAGAVTYGIRSTTMKAG